MDWRRLITRSAVRARPGEPFIFSLHPPLSVIGDDHETDSHRIDADEYCPHTRDCARLGRPIEPVPGSHFKSYSYGAGTKGSMGVTNSVTNTIFPA